MPDYLVAPRAKNDLKKIARYTKKTWGSEQRDKYLLDMEERFEWLAENSSMGTPRDEIKEGYYSFPYKKHTIFYLISEDGIISIIGIIGPGQSLEKYFS